MQPIIYLLVLVLLPIVPAALLFRVLPRRQTPVRKSERPADQESTGSVKGTLWNGMEIKLGGSFAGYFAVLALLFINHDVWNPPPPPPAPPQAFVWHLSGQITDQAGVPVEGLKQGDFEFSPLT